MRSKSSRYARVPIRLIKVVTVLLGGLAIAGLFVAYWLLDRSTVSEVNTLRILVPITYGDPLKSVEYRKMLLALEDAGGKAGDYTVELLPVDLSYFNDPGRGEDFERIGNLLRRVTGDDVVGVIGPQTSGASIQVTPILNTLGIAQLNYSATYPGLTIPDYADPQEHTRLYPTGRHTLFSTTVTNVDLVNATVAYVESVGLSSAFVVHDGASYSMNISDLFKKKFSESGGIIVASGMVKKDTVDTLVADVVRKNPQLLYISSYRHNNFYAFLRELRERGYTGYIVSPEMQMAVQKDLLPAGGKIISVNPYPTLNLANNTRASELVRRYRERFGDITRSEADTFFGPYEAVRLLLYAIEHGGGTRDGVIRVLDELENFDTLYGPVTFNDTGAIERKEIEVSEFVNDEFVFVKNIPL